MMLLVAAAAMAVSASTPPASKIVIYRPDTVKGFASGCPVRYKGQELVELGRGKFAEWPVQPGRYVISNAATSIEVTVDPGETRYVRCHMKIGGLSYRANLEISDEEDFDQGAAGMTRKDIEMAPAP